MARKTFEVAEFRARMNDRLARDGFSQEVKAAFASTLADVLLATGNYHGFNHIQWLAGGCQRWHDDGAPDDVRPYTGPEFDRFYY